MGTTTVKNSREYNDFIIGFEILGLHKHVDTCTESPPSSAYHLLQLPQSTISEISKYLTITEYLLAMRLVCKQINRDVDPSRNPKLVETVIHHTLKSKIGCNNSSLHNKMRYSTMLIASQAKYINTQYEEYLLKTPAEYYRKLGPIHACVQRYSVHEELKYYKKYTRGHPPNISSTDLQKIPSYKYFLSFIYLCHYGDKTDRNMDILFLLLAHFCFSNSALFFGYALDLFAAEYVYTHSKSGKIVFVHNQRFWIQFINLVHVYDCANTLYSGNGKSRKSRLCKKLKTFHRYYTTLCEKNGYEPEKIVAFPDQLL